MTRGRGTEAKRMNIPQCEIGMIGLGVMGRNFALNIRDRGFPVAGYDRDAKQRAAWRAECGDAACCPDQPADLIRRLRKPRAVMLLVPAGRPVDAVIRELLPLLDPGDVIIDGGNSLFSDTDVRRKAVAEKGLRYLGVGISGGESGARHGPSLMPGGPREAYERIRPVFEAAAARAEGEPCVAYLGPGSAGHYVKMVHNGIEYALLQLIAETYAVMRRGLGLSDGELRDVYDQWRSDGLDSYLLEITTAIFGRTDEGTGRPLIDVILDEAKQKGTGKWTSEDAMELQVPVPTIDAAVSMRNLSLHRERRLAIHHALPPEAATLSGERDAVIGRMRSAMYAAWIAAYAQGMAQLRAASDAYGYDLSLETVARIWRGGCIIRAALLEDIRAAFRRRSGLESLLLDPNLGSEAAHRSEDLRGAVCDAVRCGIPVPAMSASLAYLDAFRSDWLPANLIQAQRDYFGAHTYERIDEKGVFHTHWTAD
jgi:6-phosphogluconate dehydrogenase